MRHRKYDDCPLCYDDCPLCDAMTVLIGSCENALPPSQSAWENDAANWPRQIKPPFWDMYLLWESLKDEDGQD